MRIRISTPDLDPMIGDIVRMVRDKNAFVRNWAHSAAICARENARGKGGKKWWKELARSLWEKPVSEEVWDVGTEYPGARLKQYGGEVRPVDKKALTIPISEEAKGKTAYDFTRTGKSLFVIHAASDSDMPRDPDTLGILGYAGNARKKGGTSFHALFVLRTRARMRPDPWFPDAQTLCILGHREALNLLRKEEAKWR